MNWTILRYHFKHVVLVFGFAIPLISISAAEQTLDAKLVELDRQRAKLVESAIFSKKQIDFLRINIGKKRPADFSVQHLSKLKFPSPLSEFVKLYGFPDTTIVIQNSPTLSRPTVIWKYDKINVFLGIGDQDHIEVVSIYEAKDWTFEKLRKNARESP